MVKTFVLAAKTVKSSGLWNKP